MVLDYPEFLKSLDDLAQDLSEEERSELFRVALRFYTTGIKITYEIMRNVSSGGVQACRESNKQILPYLEKRAGKGHVPRFIYQL